MAGAAYTALIVAQLEKKQAQLDMQTFLRGSGTPWTLPVGINIGNNGTQVSKQLAKIIEETKSQLSKVTYNLNIDENGVKKVVSYTKEYANQMGKTVSLTTMVNKDLEVNAHAQDNIGRGLKEQLAVETKLQEMEAKRADSYHKLSVDVETFMAKTAGGTGSAISNARGVGTELLSKISERNTMVGGFGANAGLWTPEQNKMVLDADNAISALSDKFKIAQGAMTGTASAVRSWGQSLAGAIKQTITYSMSVGALYSAISQLKEGIAYIAELNKEMTKIQVLQVTGASSSQEITNLARSFNMLGSEMGATTLEIAKGSTEWLNVRSL